MIRYSILTVFMCLSLSIIAQEYALFKVVFRDKGQSEYTLDDPAGFLSPRAIERRHRFEIPVTEDDLPVSPAYIRAIESTGARILARSKWLNTVIIERITSETSAVIREMDFVESITPADDLMIKHPQSESEFSGFEGKPSFRAEQVGLSYTQNTMKSSDAILAFDYGASLNQIQMINGTTLHDQGFTGEGMVIAVLDAGFWKVDQLKVFDSLWMSNRVLGSRDYVNWGGNVFDPNIHQHGMMVLSVMGGYLQGQLVGTAPHASYYLIRTEDGTAEYLMEEYYWVMGAEYADSLGVDIINSSLGYTIFDDSLENHTYQDMDGNTTPVTIGADKAAEKGILVCNSAGNSGSSHWMYIGAPADGDSVFSIGAVDPEGNWATFSSLGPTYDGRVKPNIAAQGQQTIIAAPWGGVTGGSGTSFSSPVIAGMTACLWQANRKFHNFTVMQALQQSASRNENPDDYLGYGIPDYQAASDILGTFEANQDHSIQSLRISPNPFTDFIQFSLNVSSAQNAILQVTDMTGRLIDEEYLWLHRGDQQIRLPVRFSDPGLYIIRLQTTDQVYTGKALKNP